MKLVFNGVEVPVHKHQLNTVEVVLEGNEVIAPVYVAFRGGRLCIMGSKEQEAAVLLKSEDSQLPFLSLLGYGSNEPEYV